MRFARPRGFGSSRSGALALLIAVLAAAVSAAAPIDYTPSQITGFLTPSGLAVTDFDRDGHLDLAVTDFTANRLLLFQGDGMGGFEARSTFTGFSGPWAVAARDLNGDLRPDLLVANYSGNYVSQIMVNNSWTLQQRTDVSTGGNGPFAIASFKDTKDAVVGLGVTNFLSNTWSIVTGSVVGSGKALTPLATGTQPSAIAIADLNGDGIEDAAVTNYGSNTVSVYLAYGAYAFLPRVDYPTTGKPLGVAIGDLDEDGHLDLAVTNSTTASVSIYRGTGTGTFGTRSDITVGAGPRAIAISDLDRDGHLDLVVANQMEGSVMILAGQGVAGLGPAQTVLVGADPRGVVAADLDDPDSDLDLAIPCFGAGSVWIESARRTATGITFSATPGTTQPGEPVLMEATVLPSDVTGDVLFLDGSTVIGSVTPTLGHASLSVSDLAPGSHQLSASFAGDIVHYPSTSTTVPHLVLYPTTTSLTSSLPIAPIGTPVTLTATVASTTGTPTGDVRYTLDGSALGPVVPLTGGHASLTLTGLAFGVHSVVAEYLGNATHSPSADTLDGGQSVRRPVAVVLTVTPEPSALQDTASCVATLTPADATGEVEFLDAGVSLGRATVAGGTASFAITSLALGPHRMVARYAGDLTTTAGVSDTVTHLVASLAPAIVAVRDVPNDQGGHVALTWRYRLDRPGVRVVTGYRIWRRVPPPSAERAEARALRMLHPAGAQETFWEAIADLPAAQRISYGYTATTSQDSLASGNPYTAFLVQALTADAWTFFDSAPDSGYSVDNLAPPMPAPFAVTYGESSNRLHWTASSAPDLQAFHVHRGTSATFEATPANRIAITTDTTLTDAPGGVFYKLIAVDVHGNRSFAATASPQVPVGVLASLAALDAAADHIRIVWYAPGVTAGAIVVERRAPGGDWRDVATLFPDGSGFLPFVDTDVVAGGRYGYRLRLVDGGAPVTVAEVWVVAERLEFALEPVRPNPASDGRVTVDFALPTGAPARLELIDVAGRRVAAREVGSLGAGRHTVVLGDDRRLAPGVFLLRLTQGPEVRIRRVVVIG